MALRDKALGSIAAKRTMPRRNGFGAASTWLADAVFEEIGDAERLYEWPLRLRHTVAPSEPFRGSRRESEVPVEGGGCMGVSLIFSRPEASGRSKPVKGRPVNRARSLLSKT